MLKKLAIGAALLIASSVRPICADEPDLQAATAAVVDNQVLVQVDNPNLSDQSASIRMSVQVDDGSVEILTVPAVTYEATSTTFVSASATAPIVRIIDDPEPISP